MVNLSGGKPCKHVTCSKQNTQQFQNSENTRKKLNLFFIPKHTHVYSFKATWQCSSALFKSTTKHCCIDISLPLIFEIHQLSSLRVWFPHSFLVEYRVVVVHQSGYGEMEYPEWHSEMMGKKAVLKRIIAIKIT